jgi:hypothetical protein
VLPACNTEAMQVHLDEIATKVAPACTPFSFSIKPDGLVAKTSASSNDSLLPLPSRAPELNSQENIWRFMRHSFGDIVDHCCQAWSARPGRENRRLCADVTWDFSVASTKSQIPNEKRAIRSGAT